MEWPGIVLQVQINRISIWGRNWMFWAQKQNDSNNYLKSSKIMEDYLIINMCTDRPTSSEEKRCLGKLMMKWLGQVQKLELTTIIQMMMVVIMIMITAIHARHVIWITPATRIALYHDHSQTWSICCTAWCMMAVLPTVGVGLMRLRRKK